MAVFDTRAPAEPAFAQLAAAHGVRTAAYTVDVTSRASLDAGFAAFQADFGGRLDVLVACAGVNKNVGLLETTEEDYDRLFGVNWCACCLLVFVPSTKGTDSLSPRTARVCTLPPSLQRSR